MRCILCIARHLVSIGRSHLIELHRYCVFYKLKVYVNAALNKSIDCHLINSICSLCFSASHFGDSCHISNFFVITVFVMEICDQ